MTGFCTYGGAIDQTAVIGHPPEGREWKPGDATYAPVIDASARVEAFVTVDAGMERATSVGAGAWLMKHSHVGHDALIGDLVELAPHVGIGGHCEIGSGVKVGLNACVKPLVKVGAGARIGMGAVVLEDVPAGETWAGNPARRIA